MKLNISKEMLRILLHPNLRQQIFYVTLAVFAMMNFNLTLFVIAVVFGWFGLGCVISTIYHRQVCHKAFEYRNKYVEWLSYVLIIMTGQGSPKGWAAIHRVHHTAPDTPHDPQSLYIQGRLRTWFSWFYLENEVKHKFTTDIVKHKGQMFLDKYYYRIFLVYAIALYLIDPIFCYYFAGVAPIMGYIGLGKLNTGGHLDLTEKDGVKACLMPWPWPWLLMGEGYHKDHHTNPRKLRFGKYDLGYLFALVLAKPGSYV